MSNYQVKDNHIAAEYDVNGNVITQDEVNERVKSDIKWLKENGTALSPEQVANLAKVPVLASQLDETMMGVVAQIDNSIATELDLRDLKCYERDLSPILPIPTYPTKNNELCHPSIKYFKNGWNGYKFWMVATPYTDSNIEYENPCIWVSQNGIDWIVPDGVRVPLVERSDVRGWHSDPVFVLDKNGYTMHIVYRWSLLNTCTVRIISSNDGINWTEPVDIFNINDTQIFQITSPAFIVTDRGYEMYYINTYNNFRLEKMITTDWKTWTEPTICNVGSMELNEAIWHIDILQINGGCILTANMKDTTTQSINSKSIRLWTSNDYVNFIKPNTAIITKANPTGSIQGGGTYFYKPTTVLIEKNYRPYLRLYACTSGSYWIRYVDIAIPTGYSTINEDENSYSILLKSTGGDFNANYGTNTGVYYRCGKQITFQFSIKINEIVNQGTGNIYIDLPVATRGTINFSSAIGHYLNIQNAPALYCSTHDGNKLFIKCATDTLHGSSNISTTKIINGTYFMGSITYFTS